MAYIVPKYNDIMDIHMKKWIGYGKTRLSIVSFSTDPVPQCVNDVVIFPNFDEPSSDYNMISNLSTNTTLAQDIEDVWSIVMLE